MRVTSYGGCLTTAALAGRLWKLREGAARPPLPLARPPLLYVDASIGIRDSVNAVRTFSQKRLRPLEPQPEKPLLLLAGDPILIAVKSLVVGHRDVTEAAENYKRASFPRCGWCA